MDERLEKALEHANFKATVFQHRENLKLKLESMLTYAAEGAVFHVGPELIAFIDTLMRNGEKGGVLLDSRNHPVKIASYKELLAKLLSLYHESVNEYYIEYDKLRRARNTKTVVGL
jgi:hypothetical protein